MGALATERDEAGKLQGASCSSPPPAKESGVLPRTVGAIDGTGEQGRVNPNAGVQVQVGNGYCCGNPVKV